MPRTSRTLVRAGAVAAVLVFGPVGVASAASPAVSASTSAGRLADDPTPGASPGSMPGMDGAPMAGMDDGSMPGMTHESAPAAGSGSMPGMDDGSMPGMANGSVGGTAATGDHDTMPSMPGMADSHQDAAPVSRPVAWVVGAFVVVNGLMMAAAAVLRRRTPARRVPRRPHPAAA
ncbi:MAG TPA: hypothetical protein VHN80_02775 [Kineosporiaceae bacterium]|nr:hypothetical protein [Kineosporiaceae bacterium]